MLIQAAPTQESFQFREIFPGLVVCEAPMSDPHNWSNANEEEPAFLVYLGCNTRSERDNWIVLLQTFWGIKTQITSRRSNRVLGFQLEIKIRGMKRYSDPSVFAIDRLQHRKQYGLDYLAHTLRFAKSRSQLCEPNNDENILQNLEADAYEDMITSRILTIV
jgi:hypothetical protein